MLSKRTYSSFDTTLKKEKIQSYALYNICLHCNGIRLRRACFYPTSSAKSRCKSVQLGKLQINNKARIKMGETLSTGCQTGGSEIVHIFNGASFPQNEEKQWIRYHWKQALQAPFRRNFQL